MGALQILLGAKMAYGENLNLEQCLEENIPMAEFPPYGELLKEIPDWLVFQICHSQGKGGVKYARQHETYSSDAWGPRQHTGWPRTSFADTSGRSPAEAEKPEPGNLTQNEYRFWWGSRYPGSNLSNCRWCGNYCRDKRDRDSHFDAKGNNCSRALRVIYDYMRSCHPSYCFVCGKRTAVTRWGFPLCGNKICIEGWQFSPMSMHGTFKEAFQICEKRGLLYGYLESADRCYKR